MVVDPGDPLHRRLRELADLPEAEWLHFRPFVYERRFAKGEHLVSERGDGGTLHCIVAGLVRIYHTTDGVERVLGFDFEGRFTGAYDSVLTGAPAAFGIQALEPVRTLAFRGDVLNTLYDRHPAWDRIGRRILEEQWLRSRDKEMRFRSLKPEEHYRLLIERDSPLLGRVRLHQLASYLGITPETLSRIRSRVRAARNAASTTAPQNARPDS